MMIMPWERCVRNSWRVKGTHRMLQQAVKRAVEKVSLNGMYTIVLTDLVMSDMDGIEVLKDQNNRIRKLMLL